MFDIYLTNPFYKISLYQGFTSKRTLIGWVRYHLRTVIKEEMLSWSWADSNVNNLRHFTLYNALINKSEQVYTHSIDSKVILLSPISKITAYLNCPIVDKLIVCTTMVSNAITVNPQPTWFYG